MANAGVSWRPRALPTVAVGMPAGAFVVELVRAIPEIETVRFLSYAVSSSLDSRLSALPGELDFTAKLREALVHDPSGRTMYEVCRADVTSQYVDSLKSVLAPNFALALTSRVDLHDGTTGHIPMLDLKCAVSPAGQSAVAEFLREIGCTRGALLDSGQSYHYYGFEAITEPEWRVFLGTCLLSAALVDTRYIAHRLIDGYCSLRINRTVTKPKVPAVIEFW